MEPAGVENQRCLNRSQLISKGGQSLWSQFQAPIKLEDCHLQM
jgi:hypothetical protein